MARQERTRRLLFGEYRVLCRTQTRARLEADILHHYLIRSSIHFQRFCPTVRPVKGKHELFVKRFPERIPGAQLSEFSDYLSSAPQADVGSNAFLQDGDPFLVETKGVMSQHSYMT